MSGIQVLKSRLASIDIETLLECGTVFLLSLVGYNDKRESEADTKLLNLRLNAVIHASRHPDNIAGLVMHWERLGQILMGCYIVSLSPVTVGDPRERSMSHSIGTDIGARNCQS